MFWFFYIKNLELFIICIYKDIKPENSYQAAILLDADINFDLAAPLDYNEN